MKTYAVTTVEGSQLTYRIQAESEAAEQNGGLTQTSAAPDDAVVVGVYTYICKRR